MEHLGLLTTYQLNNKIRLGNIIDGGYVIGDIDEKYDCYISAGVSNEESFSRDFIKKYNMNKVNSYAFDGTIQDYPYEYTRDITYIKKNINSYNDNNNTNLDFLTQNYRNIFLKMDIEGGEYNWLLQITNEQLNNIKQIVIEFHGITNDSWGCKYYDKIKCLQKLACSHFIIHTHGNNHSYTHNGIPDVIELTYINKNFFKSIPDLNNTLLPIDGLDFSNKPNGNDINLSFYPFVSGISSYEQISIGISYTNIKEIHFNNNPLYEYKFKVHDHVYADKFEFTIIDNTLLVKRIDYDGGWLYEHYVTVYYFLKK